MQGEELGVLSRDRDDLDSSVDYLLRRGPRADAEVHRNHAARSWTAGEIPDPRVRHALVIASTSLLSSSSTRHVMFPITTTVQVYGAAAGACEECSYHRRLSSAQQSSGAGEGVQSAC